MPAPQVGGSGGRGTLQKGTERDRWAGVQHGPAGLREGEGAAGREGAGGGFLCAHEAREVPAKACSARWGPWCSVLPISEVWRPFFHSPLC